MTRGICSYMSSTEDGDVDKGCPQKTWYRLNISEDISICIIGTSTDFFLEV
jgi:hypothetical protein